MRGVKSTDFDSDIKTVEKIANTLLGKGYGSFSVLLLWQMFLFCTFSNTHQL